MTPLEAVCRAMRDSEPGMESRSWRYWLPSARAALAALADSACPREALLPHGMTPRHWTMMRAILRVVAEHQADDELSRQEPDGDGSNRSAQVLSVLKLFEEGLRISEIAKELSVHEESVRLYLQESFRDRMGLDGLSTRIKNCIFNGLPTSLIEGLREGPLRPDDVAWFLRINSVPCFGKKSRSEVIGWLQARGITP